MQLAASHMLRENMPRDGQPKLLDQLREVLRPHSCCCYKETPYLRWLELDIHFHNVRHPAEMAEPGINAFLTHLAVKENVAARDRRKATREQRHGILVHAG